MIGVVESGLSASLKMGKGEGVCVSFGAGRAGGPFGELELSVSLGNGASALLCFGWSVVLVETSRGVRAGFVVVLLCGGLGLLVLFFGHYGVSEEVPEESDGDYVEGCCYVEWCG